MNPYRKVKLSVVVTLTLATMAGFVPNVYAYIQATDNPPGTAGTFGSLDQIVGGDQFLLTSSTDQSLQTYNSYQDWFKYAPDSATIKYTSGSQESGGIWHFDHIHDPHGSIVANNGFLMIGPSTLNQWIQALHGDTSYVTDPTRLFKTTFRDSTNGATFNVINIAQLELESGASFAPGSGSNTRGATIWATDPPTAQVTLPSGSTVNQGKALGFNAIAGIEQYHAYYHYEYVQIIGADGRNYTSQGVGKLVGAVNPGQQLTVQTQGGGTVLMQEVSGGGNDSMPPTYNTIINGHNGSAGYSTPNQVNTSNLPSQSYTLYFYVKDYFNRAATVAQASFSVQGGSPPPPGGGGGNGGGGGGQKCPAPVVPPKPADYVESYNWSPDGSGGQILTWVDSNWVQQTTTDAQGCIQYKWVDQPKTYTHDYPLNLNNIQVTGLFYDPGSPTNMWSPNNQTGSQNNHDQFSNGSSIGGSQPLPTFGNPNRSPAVYVRIGGGFSFRLMWTGSPHDMPASASVGYRLVNPNGDANTWTKSFQLLPSTTYNMGDQPTWDPSGNGYPPAATEYGWSYTSIPKYAVTGTPSSYTQLAKWNLTGDTSTAAHVEANVTFTTGTGSGVTWRNTGLAQALGYPTWFFIHEVPDPNAPYSSSQPQWSNSYSFKTP